MYRCPVCGNTEVRRGKYFAGYDTTGRDLNAYDFFCGKCGTLEQKTESDLDFERWLDRWSNAQTKVSGSGGKA